MIKRLLSFLAAGLLSLTLVADVGGVVIDVGVLSDSVTGTGWSYANSKLTLSGEGSFVLHGTNKSATVQVAVNANSTVVLSNLCLQANTSGRCAFQINSGAHVNVLLAGENELKSGNGRAGLGVMADASISLAQIYETIPGSLDVSGGSRGAGIGSGVDDECGDIFINGGKITATGGEYAAGIGGGEDIAGGNVFIRGGVVTAEGGEDAAGIGGGYSGDGGNVIISGGTVVAKANGDADDIGGGSEGVGAVVAFTGGSVHAVNGQINTSPTNALGEVVHCVTVTGLVANAAVELKDLNGYGDQDIFADEKGWVYLWLTNGTYKSFLANGLVYRAEVRGEPTIAEMLPKTKQPIGVFVDGVDVGREGTGAGWEFVLEDRTLAFTGTGPFDVSGTNSVLSSLRLSTTVQTQVRFTGFASAGLQFAGAFEFVGGTVVAQESQGPLTVTDGTVDVGRILGPPTITGGSVKCGNFAVPPSNGTERVWCVTVPNLLPSSAVTVTGLGDYGVDGLVADANGCLYLWLPDGDYIFRANRNGMRAIVEGADVQAVAVGEVTLTGVTVNGVDVAYRYGSGWTNAVPQVVLADARDFVLSGTNGEGNVLVSVQANARVVLSDLTLTSQATYPFSIAGACEVEILLSGTNQLTSTGLGRPGLRVPAGAGCVIDALGEAGGCLSVSGGDFSSGMGGAYGDSGTGNIEVKGGTIVATMGQMGGSDIGGGALGGGGEVVISGGSVNVTTAIKNAPVNEQGAAVFCVTVPGLTPNTAVTVTGLGDYGVDGLVADTDGQIYLWLPNGEKTFTAGGRKFAATVAGAAVTAVDQGPATEVVSPTELVVTSFSIANGVARLEITTDLGMEDFAAWLSTEPSFEIDFRAELGGEILHAWELRSNRAILAVELPSDYPQGFLVVRALNR